MAAVLVFSALVLTGCAMPGPDYHPPEPDAAARWSDQGAPTSGDPAVLAAWWRQFGDSTLDGLVTDALAANVDLATAEAKLREVRAQRKAAGATLGPTLDATASASKTKRSSGSSDLFSVGFDASWEADVFGGLRRGVEAADADLGASLENLRDARVSLIAEVVVNYVDLRRAERRLVIAEANIAALNESFDLARWRLQAGLASELDIAQARTELERARAGLPALKTSADQAGNRLAVLLNRTPSELGSRLASAGGIPHMSRDIAVGIPADTLRQRPDVRAAERRLAAQTARLGEAEAARYPSFRLSGSIGLEALSLSALGDTGTGVSSLLGSITAPIFHWNRIQAGIEIEDAKLEQARLAYRSAVLTALEDVENALVAVRNTGERLDRLKVAADSAGQTLPLAEQRYSGGLVDFLTVLDARRTVQDLEDQVAAAGGDLATAEAQLYKALGGGWRNNPQPTRIGKNP
ncbi:MAG: efflux transporter outer membrane subunit [Gammaproteobacteria bacterium]|nr:efflux transporter outer membrane subunit [Gammaproteobacteria bacterium]